MNSDYRSARRQRPGSLSSQMKAHKKTCTFAVTPKRLESTCMPPEHSLAMHGALKLCAVSPARGCTAMSNCTSEHQRTSTCVGGLPRGAPPAPSAPAPAAPAPGAAPRSLAAAARRPATTATRGPPPAPRRAAAAALRGALVPGVGVLERPLRLDTQRRRQRQVAQWLFLIIRVAACVVIVSGLSLTYMPCHGQDRTRPRNSGPSFANFFTGHGCNRASAHATAGSAKPCV